MVTEAGARNLGREPGEHWRAHRHDMSYRFAEFFKSFRAELPMTTRMVLSLSDFIGEWGFAIGIGAVIGALAIALRSARIRKRGRLMLVGGTAFGFFPVLEADPCARESLGRFRESHHAEAKRHA